MDSLSRSLSAPPVSPMPTHAQHTSFPGTSCRESRWKCHTSRWQPLSTACQPSCSQRRPPRSVGLWLLWLLSRPVRRRPRPSPMASRYWSVAIWILAMHRAQLAPAKEALRGSWILAWREGRMRRTSRCQKVLCGARRYFGRGKVRLQHLLLCHGRSCFSSQLAR